MRKELQMVTQTHAFPVLGELNSFSQNNINLPDSGILHIFLEHSIDNG